VHDVGRGGDVTYHGPGQLVAYPIVELTPDRRDVHRYVRDLEEAMMRVCADYGLVGARVAGRSGCWVGDEKVGAIGVRISRWVTSHGLALNVATDLAPFRLIVPCGIGDKGVTSLHMLLGREPSMEDVAQRLTVHLAEVLGREPSWDARAAV
jgi:lipoyl(octanoyl) transferase